MAHFAQIDDNNIVQQVIVVSDQDAVSGLGPSFINFVLGLTGTWIETDHCSRWGKHFIDIPVLSGDKTIGFSLSATNLDPLRHTFAGIGYVYNQEYDVFHLPKPINYPSFVLDTDTFQWFPPIPKPTDGPYRWDENTTSWTAVTAASAIAAWMASTSARKPT